MHFNLDYDFVLFETEFYSSLMEDISYTQITLCEHLDWHLVEFIDVALVFGVDLISIKRKRLVDICF